MKLWPDRVFGGSSPVVACFKHSMMVCIEPNSSPRVVRVQPDSSQGVVRNQEESISTVVGL